MPTAAKLVAAILFALTGYLTADAVRPHLPEAMPAKQLVLWSVVIPMICGWRVIGKYIRRGGIASAVNTGIYAISVSVFFTLFAFSFAEMIDRSTRKQYSGPVDAIVNMFGVTLEMGTVLLHPGPIIILIGSAVITGIAALWADRKWG